MHENDVLDAFIVVFVRALDKQTSNHRPKDQRTHAKNLQYIPGKCYKTLSHHIDTYCCILGWKCRRRVGDFFLPKRQTCRHVGAVSPTRHRPCRRHCLVSARQTLCLCRVGMTICRHVGKKLLKVQSYGTILCNNR